MKITDVRILLVSGESNDSWARGGTRHVIRLDAYPEWRDKGLGGATNGDEPRKVSAIYVEIKTDGELFGLHGPISREQAFVIHSKFRPFLIGRDPLLGEMLWDQMARLDRHSRSGLMMMTISAIDCALWDIRGKAADLPVFQLLGGPTRDRIRAYGSMGGHSVEPDRAGATAQDALMRGFKSQKWFFAYGPGDGAAGMSKNLELVETLRSRLGAEAELMFDAVQAWDLPYAIEMARGMEPFRPKWLEEALPAGRLPEWKRLKAETNIPLAAGEHLYTRWDVRPFLEAGILSYVQADPEWTGGITELVKICALADAYGAKVIPHAHHVLPAAHVVASQPPELCPMAEYLFRHLDKQQFFHEKPLRAKDGWLELPEGPGMGVSLDETKIKDMRELNWE